MFRSFQVALGLVCLAGCSTGEEEQMTRSVPGAIGLKVRRIAFSPDGRIVAAAHLDKVIRLWDAPSGALVGELKGHTEQIYAVAFSADGKTLLSGGNEPNLRLWDVARKTESGVLRKHTRAVLCLAFSADGRTLATGGGFDEAAARLWDYPSLKEVACFTIKERAAGIDTLALAPDGKSLATPGDVFGSVHLWDVMTGRGRTVLTSHDVGIVRLGISPDNKVLAALGGDHLLRMWDFDTSRERAFPAGAAMALAFSPDGKIIVTAGGTSGSVHSPGQFILWEVATGRKIGERVVPNHPISCLAFSPDGRRFVTGSLFGAVPMRFWAVSDIESP